jgi:hypothetical protein
LFAEDGILSDILKLNMVIVVTEPGITS